MASSNQKGLNAMLNGKSSHRQYMISQNMLNHAYKVTTVKSAIDMSCPKAFSAKVSRRSGGNPSSKSRPVSKRHNAQSDKLFVSNDFGAIPMLDVSDNDYQDTRTARLASTEKVSADIIDAHNSRFTEARPFTPRTLKRPSSRSLLRESGAYRPIRKPKPHVSNQTIKFPKPVTESKYTAEEPRKGTYCYKTEPFNKTSESPVISVTKEAKGDPFFDSIPPDYMEFANCLIKDISNSNVTSDEGINIVMERNIAKHKESLNLKQMKSICDLYRRQLSISDTSDYTSTLLYTQDPAHSHRPTPIRRSNYHKENVEVLPKPASTRAPQAETLSSQRSEKIAEADQSEMVNPILPAEISSDRNEVTLEYLKLAKETNESGNPVDNGELPVHGGMDDQFSQSATASVTSLDDESVSGFNMTLKPGEFSALQTDDNVESSYKKKGKPALNKTVHFVSDNSEN